MAYPDLYKHSIFFEILSLDQNGEAGTTLESFAFSMPPSNIEIVQGQRVTTTPTPGGFFVDNYGLGAAKITISGETGNEESRLTILGPGKTPRSLTGQESYFEFRNKIVRYSQKSENYTMRFYDLTNSGTVNLFRKNSFDKVSKYTEAWEVVLDESSLRRSNVKPMFYPYSISLTGIRPLGTFNPRLAKNAVGFLSNIREKIDSATETVSIFNANLELFLSNNFEYLTDITDILSSTNSFLKQLTNFTGLFIEYEQKIGGLFQDVVSETETALNSGLQLISFPYDTLETAREQIRLVRSKTESFLTKATIDGKAALDKYDWDKTQDPVSEIGQKTTDIETSFNGIMTTAKQSSSYEPVGAIAVNGVVTPIYGFSIMSVLENTRLDKLAKDLFGDPDMKDMISGINGIYSNDELIKGTVLKIPILSPNTRYANNAVYNVPGENDDVLGRDAKVNEDGIFVTDPSDYSLTSGDETIIQAILFRLAEKKGRQLRDGTYGIVFQIGEALNNESPFEILSISLAETLIQDPRITDVYDLNFLGDGDKVYQEFKFDSITRLAIVYKEGI
jgi:hypothetical protein